MRDLTSGDPVVVLAGYPREMEKFLKVNPGLSRRFQVRFTFQDYSVGQLAAIFAKIADRNAFRLARDCGLSAVERVLSEHFSESLCRKWNGGLPEGLFRRAQDALAKRLNVLTMSADVATTLTIADVAAGARILASTLGDETPAPRRSSRRAVHAAPAAPAPAARAAAPPEEEDDDDDDDDVYGSDAGDDGLELAETSNPLLANILQSLGGADLPFDRLKNVPDRLDRLERAVARLARPPPPAEAPNPWSEGRKAVP